MELLQLRYFLEVAESEHVTHSAQKLRVSQPSLTQAISRLERELGVQLFEPEGRGIRLTEAGRFYSKRIAKAVRFCFGRGLGPRACRLLLANESLARQLGVRS